MSLPLRSIVLTGSCREGSARRKSEKGPGMSFRFLKRLWAEGRLGRRARNAPGPTRTILLVSASRSERNTVRVFALLEGWRLLAASDLPAAIALLRREQVTVILYDRDLLGIEWSPGVIALHRTEPSAGLILLSFARDELLRLKLLALGGYDLALKPLTLPTLAPLVIGYTTLLQDLDSIDLRTTHEGGARQPLGIKV
jgi:hypothetical protein